MLLGASGFTVPSRGDFRDFFHLHLSQRLIPARPAGGRSSVEENGLVLRLALCRFFVVFCGRDWFSET